MEHLSHIEEKNGLYKPVPKKGFRMHSLGYFKTKEEAEEAFLNYLQENGRS